MSRSNSETQPTPAATTQPGWQGVFSVALGSPALGTAAAVLAATSAAAPIAATVFAAQPDVPRVVTATTTGTAANVTAQQVVVTGTDIEGQPLAETLPAFTAAALGTVTGAKAFATVTNVACPTVGASVNVSIGLGPKLGLRRRMSRDAVLNAFLGGVRESTRPAVTFDPAVVAGNGVTLSSALNGSAVVVDSYGTLN